MIFEQIGSQTNLKDELVYRFELVRVEVGPARLHRIVNIREIR